MTATNHVLAGTLIALVVKRPELAIPVSLVSHFVMDAIPHYAPRDLAPRLTKNLGVLDGLISILLGVVFAITATAVSAWLIFACALAAVLPDLIWTWRYYRLRDIKKVFEEPISSFSKWHLRIQTEFQAGAIVEVVFFATVLMSIIHRL